MTLYAVLDYNRNLNRIIKSEFNLQSINLFYRSTVKELCLVASEKLLTSKDDTELRYRIDDEINNIKMIFHIYMGKNDRYIAITDEKYPTRLITNLFLDLCSTNEIKEIWNKYREPEKIDKIGIVQKELEETKVIILDSLQKLQIRGESLEQLVLKSDELSNSSKLFMQKSKDLNRCCIII